MSSISLETTQTQLFEAVPELTIKGQVQSHRFFLQGSFEQGGAMHAGHRIKIVSSLRLIVPVAAWLLIGLTSSAKGDDNDEFFEKKIRPILAGTCFRCHGDLKTAGELRTDTEAALLEGGFSGPAIVHGKPDESLLMQAVRREEGISAMPPDKSLPADQIKDLEEWIRQGAVWPKVVKPFETSKHWAFEPIQDVSPPEVQQADWPQTSLDRFILADLEREGLHPSSRADRLTLIRRVTYDLTGLPPTAEQVDAYLADTRSEAEAYRDVVERLLASPQYGEHWGRHWLDVVRYADTAGENSDHPLPHAWKYRNWVINSINKDQPYDQFLRDQIAGDLLPKDVSRDEVTDRIVATGYLAIARRFGHDIDQDMHLTYEDTIDTLGKSVLGLTLGCCRCHDHKYDPVSAKDYYGLYGIFESTQFAFPGCEPKQQPRHLVPLAMTDEDEERAKGVDSQIAVVDEEVLKLKAEDGAAAQEIKIALSRGSEILSEGEISEGGTAELASGVKAGLEKRNIKRGEVLLLSIRPLGNYGADTTAVELEIAEQGGEKRLWSTADLTKDLLQGNPHGGVWCFVSTKEGMRLLKESVSEINGRKELQAWRNNGDVPSAFVNSSDMPVNVWTELSPKTFFMHPAENESVGLAWISPIDGEVSISGRITDGHPGGPDGVGWKLEQIGQTDIGSGLARQGELLLKLSDANRRMAALKESRPVIPVAYAVVDGTPHDTRLQKRGEPTDLGDEVPRKFLDILGGQKLESPNVSGRLELAQWLTASTNPLTPRVMANRIWQWHFGQGIVSSPNDFGTRGSPPTHPALLDHLATEFVKSRWSLKAMHRLIVMSATYQQATARSDEGKKYEAFPRRRLTAEELRDTLLMAGGELDLSPGEAHPFPAESTWSFTQHNPFAAEYETPKRSVYVMQKRNRRSRFFALFDGADPNASTPVRDVTTVPTQALFFLNDPFLHAEGAKFAERIEHSAGENRESLNAAYRILFGRAATDDEWSEAEAFLLEYQTNLTEVPPEEREHKSWEAYARVLLGSNEVLYVE